jgi:hypothetical protein
MTTIFVVSIGYGLDERAVSAMQGAVFHPALENGKPVSYEMQMFVNF